MEWWSGGVFWCFQHSNTPLLHYSITPSLHYSIAPGRQFSAWVRMSEARLLPEQLALPSHQTALVLFPIPGQRAECGPAGNQGRVDVQFRGPTVASLAQGII